MSIETDLTTILKTVCPRTFPVVAPAGTARPYVTYTLIGGRPLRWLDGSAADKRHSIVQVSVWSDSLLTTAQTIRAIEDALCAAAVVTARPQEEPRTDYEPETKLYGAMQDFDIYSDR